MSSTSSSRFSGVSFCHHAVILSCFGGRARLRASALFPDEKVTIGPVPGRESDGPTRAGAKCTMAGCSPSIRNRSFPSFSAQTRSCRRAPPPAPAAPGVLASTYHWSVRNGSITTVRTVAERHHVRHAASILSRKPTASIRSTICLARVEAILAVYRSPSNDPPTAMSARKSSLP